jgi:dTDP-4-dehydrorhamnose reductase
MDITDAVQVATVVAAKAPDVVVHAAAYTDVAGAERERERCWQTNVAGTRHVARAAATVGALLVHISTDYVFDGRRGGYHEDDVPGPALNYYALSKIAAEEVARMAPRHLVLRTSFRPREWPYPVAFADVYTSQDYVDVIAPDIALVVRHIQEIPFDTLHVATERKSVYELARRRKPDVRAGSKVEARVTLPDDVSLDVGRWRALKPQLLAKEA